MRSKMLQASRGAFVLLECLFVRILPRFVAHFNRARDADSIGPVAPSHSSLFPAEFASSTAHGYSIDKLRFEPVPRVGLIPRYSARFIGCAGGVAFAGEYSVV